MPKELLSIMLLNTLPDEFQNFCVALETRENLPVIGILKITLLKEIFKKVPR